MILFPFWQPSSRIYSWTLELKARALAMGYQFVALIVGAVHEDYDACIGA